MMNPYVEWLGLPEGTTNPNHFELLQIDAEKVDHVAAGAAADRALTQVRGCKPGSNAKEWASLLDEIRTAKKVLSKPESFEEYRHQIKSAFMRPPAPGESLSKPKAEDSPSDQPVQDEAPHELVFDAKAVGGKEIKGESFTAQPPQSELVESTQAEAPMQASPEGFDALSPPTSNSASKSPSASTSAPSEAPLAAEPVMAAEPVSPAEPAEAPVLKVSAPANPPAENASPPAGNAAAATPPASKSPPAAAEPAQSIPAQSIPTQSSPTQSSPTLSPTAVPEAPTSIPAQAIPAEPEPAEVVPTPPAAVPVVTAQAAASPATFQPATPQPSNVDPQAIDPMAPVALPIQSAEPLGANQPVAIPTQPEALGMSPAGANSVSSTEPRQVSEELVVVEESGGRGNKRFIRSMVIGLCCAGLMCIGGYLVADAAGLFDGDDSQTAQAGDGENENNEDGSGGNGGGGQNSGGNGDGNSNGGGNGSGDNGSTDTDSTNNGGSGGGGTTNGGEETNNETTDNDGGNGTDSTDNGSTDNGTDNTGQTDTDDGSSDGGNGTDTTDDMNDTTDSGDDPGEPEAADVIRFGEQLAEVNRVLYERDVEQARQLLESAREINVRPMDMAMADRLELMIDQIERFWQSVEDGVAKLQGGMELKVNETTFISIVEVRSDMLIYRFAGETYRKKPIELPPGLAMIIAEDSLPQPASENRIVKGAFYAIERVTDPNRRDKAEAYWEEASFMGADTDDLIAYLDDDYNLAVSLIEQVAMPDAASIDDAQTQVREAFAKDFAAAKTPAERTDLANRLAEEAPKTTDLAERYALLIEARDWAARAGDAPMVLELVDLIDSWFEIDNSLTLKGEAIVDAAKVSSGVDASKEVARTALELAEEAERADDEDLMNELLQSALLASRRSRDREYQTTVRERVDEIRAEAGT